MSLGQKWSRKNSTSTPTTTATIVKAKSQPSIGLPMAPSYSAAPWEASAPHVVMDAGAATRLAHALDGTGGHVRR